MRLFIIFITVSSLIILGQENDAEIGNKLYKVKNFKDAIPSFKKHIVKNPLDEKIINRLAVCYYKTKQYKKAINLIESKLLIFVNSPKRINKYKLIIAKCLYRMNLFEQSIEHITRLMIYNEFGKSIFYFKCSILKILNMLAMRDKEVLVEIKKVESELKEEINKSSNDKERKKALLFLKNDLSEKKKESDYIKSIQILKSLLKDKKPSFAKEHYYKVKSFNKKYDHEESILGIYLALLLKDSFLIEKRLEEYCDFLKKSKNNKISIELFEILKKIIHIAELDYYQYDLISEHVKEVKAKFKKRLEKIKEKKNVKVNVEEIKDKFKKDLEERLRDRSFLSKFKANSFTAFHLFYLLFSMVITNLYKNKFWHYDKYCKIFEVIMLSSLLFIFLEASILGFTTIHLNIVIFSGYFLIYLILQWQYTNIIFQARVARNSYNYNKDQLDKRVVFLLAKLGPIMIDNRSLVLRVLTVFVEQKYNKKLILNYQEEKTNTEAVNLVDCLTYDHEDHDSKHDGRYSD